MNFKSVGRSYTSPFLLVLLKEQFEVVINTCSLESKVLVRKEVYDETHAHTKKVRNQLRYIDAFAKYKLLSI